MADCFSFSCLVFTQHAVVSGPKSPSMGGAELGGGAGDLDAADCCLELVYTGGGFGAVVRGEGSVASAATSAAAAAAAADAAAAGSDVQRLKSLQFGEYRAVLRCGGGG